MSRGDSRRSVPPTHRQKRSCDPSHPHVNCRCAGARKRHEAWRNHGKAASCMPLIHMTRTFEGVGGSWMELCPPAVDSSMQAAKCLPRVQLRSASGPISLLPHPELHASSLSCTAHCSTSPRPSSSPTFFAMSSARSAKSEPCHGWALCAGVVYRLATLQAVLGLLHLSSVHDHILGTCALLFSSSSMALPHSN